ncbi:MAG: biotin/lipoyl-binding protein, partial [Waddliaceae bacterium]
MTDKQTESGYQATIRALSVAQKLTTKAIEAQDVDNLIFIILNDTYHILPYDRAILFTKEENRIRELGVSGQAVYKADTELLTRLKALIKNMKDPETSRVLSEEDVEENKEDWNFLQSTRATTVFWIPFQLKDGSQMGLWLEKWGDPNAKTLFEQNGKLLTELVIPGYVAAWNRIGWGFSWQKLFAKVTLPRVGYFFAILLILFFAIRLPLRVVAPCEVVALDPYVIAAPLEGIIEEVVVEPGEHVEEDQVLYEYDKRVPIQEYKVAQKEVEIIKSELSRVFASGLEDEDQLYQMATLNVRLKKSELDLAFAKSR